MRTTPYVRHYGQKILNNIPAPLLPDDDDPHDRRHADIAVNLNQEYDRSMWDGDDLAPLRVYASMVQSHPATVPLHVGLGTHTVHGQTKYAPWSPRAKAGKGGAGPAAGAAVQADGAGQEVVGAEKLDPQLWDRLFEAL